MANKGIAKALYCPLNALLVKSNTKVALFKCTWITLCELIKGEAEVHPGKDNSYTRTNVLLAKFQILLNFAVMN